MMMSVHKGAPRDRSNRFSRRTEKGFDLSSFRLTPPASKCLGCVEKSSRDSSALRKIHQNGPVNRFREYRLSETNFGSFPPAKVNSPQA